MFAQAAGQEKRASQHREKVQSRRLAIGHRKAEGVSPRCMHKRMWQRPHVLLATGKRFYAQVLHSLSYFG